MPVEYKENEQLPWEEDSKSSKKIRLKRPHSSSLYIWVIISLVIITIFFGISILASNSVVNFNEPSVVEIEQIDSYPISNREIEEDLLAANYYDRLETDFSAVDYKYKVTLDNGKEFILSPGSRVQDIGAPDSYLEVNGYIWTDEHGQIIKSSENTVEITVSAKIINSSSRHDILGEYECTYEKEIVDCIVEDLRCVSTTPVSVYKDCDKIFIDGCEIEIIYSDGRKVVAKPEMSEDGTYQTLDGHTLNVWGVDDNEDGTDERVGISILDFFDVCEIDITEKEYPFSAIELTDCTFDENYRITSFSYKVTYKDGTVKQFSNQKLLPELSRHWVMKSDDSFEVSPLHGYYVIAEPEFIFPEESEKAQIKVKLSVGFKSEDQVVTTKVFACPENDCDCICHNNDRAVKKCYEKFRPVLEFFSLNQYCKCGIYHYEISSF